MTVDDVVDLVSSDEHAYDYDLVVIGTGPGGQKAAIAAAKLGHRVAIIEKRHMMGGVSVNTGTIPSKTLREAVMYLTGMAQREVYGASYRVKSEITMDDLFARTHHVIGRETEVIRAQLIRNHIDILNGTGSFVDAHTLAVTEEGASRPTTTVTGRFIVIATGSTPHRPDSVQFDERTVLDSDGVLALEKVPTSMVVVGAGIIGIEYASMFAALGTRVTIIDKRPSILEMCDPEVAESLKFHLRDLSVSFRFSEEVAGVDSFERGTVTRLVSGKKIAADAVMYSAGRQGQTDSLDLQNAGLSADSRGRIKVDDQYRTAVPHIFAVGDVIGFPALAATSMDQGRLAAYHAFEEPARELQSVQPIGIYTIPEISYCGRTEEELTTEAVPYEVGIARYRELARGQIVGDSYGMLKLLVHTESRELLGVHIFGTLATDLVHIGQAIMACGGTVDYLVDTVLNYPTLSEAYKVAALDATNKIRQVARFSQ